VLANNNEDTETRDEKLSMPKNFTVAWN